MARTSFPNPSRGAPLGLVALALLAGCTGERPDSLPTDRPWIQVSATRVTFVQTAAFMPETLSPTTLDLRLANGGGGEPSADPSATPQYSGPEEWLEAERHADASGWGIMLKPVATEFLEAGVYTANLEVAWEGAANSPVDVEVTLTVLPHPGLWQPGRAVANGRFSHTTTALPGGGALAVGGTLAETSVERLDPRTGAWKQLGPLRWGRTQHTATLLQDGLVFIAGGRTDVAPGNPPGATWELYDPDAEEVITSGDLVEERWGHSAVLLPDGRVVLLGGVSQADPDGKRSVEMFDPWLRSTVSRTVFPGTEGWQTPALVLANGDVVFTCRTASGTDDGFEVFHPQTWGYDVLARRTLPRGDHALVALPDGPVLVLGGYTAQRGTLADVEAYDPGTGSWSWIGELAMPVHGIAGAAVVTPLGRVLVAGGWRSPQSLTSAVQVFQLGVPPAIVGALGSPRWLHTVTVLGDGRILTLGGSPVPDRPEFWRDAPP